MFRHVAGIIAVVIGLLASRAAAAGPWVRVESPHFVVSGNVGEGQARQVATRLEQFREILLRIFPQARLAVRPLFVVAFDSERAFRPYKPLFNGKPQPVAGYFARSNAGTCVTLQLDRGEESYPLIFHEYAHLFLSQNSPMMPTWLSEGVAEYYSTVEVIRQGREANVARPVVRHVRLLRERFMPLRELLTTTQESKIWGDSDQAALFYAESWALVHYLSSHPGGSKKISQLVDLLGSGRPDIAAFEEVFDLLPKVERELREYVQRSAYSYSQFRFERTVSAEQAPARRLSPGEVESSLARILIHLGRNEEAAEHVAAALKGEPDLPEAHLARGLLEFEAGRPEDAEQEFQLAVAKAPGNLDAAYDWGLSLTQITRTDPAKLRDAAAAIRAALPAEDPPADVLAVLGLLQVRNGQLEEAEVSLHRAMKLAPGETGTAIGLAEVLIRRAKFDDARGVLGPMMARPTHPGLRDVARRMLAGLAREEANLRERAELARLAATDADADKAGDREGVHEPRPLDAGRTVLLFRKIGEGEQRQAGVLERIVCGPGGLVMQLKTSAGIMRFHARRFEDVEFITYRNDLLGGVPCGARKPADPVYLTWRAISEAPPQSVGNIDGVTVAIEFLPK